MAKQAFTNANITLAGTDISAYVKQVTLTVSAAELETTSMGATAKSRIAGLKDHKVQIELFQDFSPVEGLVYPLVGGTAVTMVIKPNGTATASTANPQYSFSVLCTEWNPVSGAVGDVMTSSQTWPISGDITKTP